MPWEETQDFIRSGHRNPEEFEALVDAVSLEKLAKMLRILGFLTQTKVYLFWEKHQS